jgi:hypothetical protein
MSGIAGECKMMKNKKVYGDYSGFFGKNLSFFNHF